MESSFVVGIHFSRNFGKEAAMFAGLQYARGDCCAILDCDLQHPPEKLVEMYHLWKAGYEVVEGIKEDRGGEKVGCIALPQILFILLLAKLLVWICLMHLISSFSIVKLLIH